MQELHPRPTAGVDPVDRYATDRRPPHDRRPWVLMNMVATVDGATAVDGVSGGLGGPADRQVFSAIRAVADVILVAAGTVRAEAYGPPRTPPELQEQRRARGQAATPRIAIVTRSLRLDLDTPLFTESVPAPLVITAPEADLVRRTEVAERADLLLAGSGDDVDLTEALEALADLDAGVVLVEGGPSLNGQLVAADLIDEVCLTMAPRLAAGSSKRIAETPTPVGLQDLELDRILEQDGLLFLRYLRRSDR